MLTGINSTTVASDAIGNITNDGTWTFTWKNGRQLAAMENDSERWDFSYDASGMRTQRSNGNTTYKYTYEGTTLTQMTVGSNTLIFAYGVNGHPMGVKYNGTSYYYVTNAFGDVLAIIDNSCNELVTYTYDTWGNIISISGTMASTLGKYNPFRYRGYVYDQETGLYYLQSRYYNPDICRFISADSISYLGADGTPVSYNLFAYCGNNPVMYSDPTGHIPEWLSATLKIAGGAVIIAGCIAGSIFSGGTLSVVLAGAAIGATAGGVGAGISTAISGGDIHNFANAFLVSTATGAISGAIAAGQWGTLAQAGINAALGTTNYAVTQKMNGGKITLVGLAANALIGGACGFIGQSGWMQGQKTAAFIAFGGKNALKHVIGMVGTETLLRMTLPAMIIGGVGGGIYGRISEIFNPYGNFVGI